MTPVRSATKIIPALVALMVIAFASLAIAQLQAPEQKPPRSTPAATRQAAEERADTLPTEATRTGAPQAAAEKPAPIAGQEVTSPENKDPGSLKPGETAAASAEVASQEQDATETADSAPARTPDAAAEKPAAPDMTAFVEALRAAERANENLAARLAQMEASTNLQRERDQAFIRDMIRGVLLLSGGMAALGMIALVAIVYLQVRSSKQQAITFAAQLQAITSHAALPGPGTPAHAALPSSKGRFDSTARNIEEKLSDLESMATGIAASPAEIHESDIPGNATPAGGSSAFPMKAGPVRGENAADLLSKANSLLTQQQPEVALAYLDQAISRSPQSSEAHLKRGSALERLNRLDEALSAYDRAIESAPTLSVAFLAKAGVLNKLQRYGEALKCYEVALAQQGGMGESESPAA